MTEEVTEGPPSRRANATLTACPNGAHLWCIGGEYFSEDGKAVRLELPFTIYSHERLSDSYVYLMHLLDGA